MAKNKADTNENGLFIDLAKGIGGELLEDRDKIRWGYIDTGILALNYALSGKFVGGGVPGGTCFELYGSSSSGKSLVGTNILRGCQTANGIAILLDAERTISKDFAVKASHVDPKKLIVMESDTLEQSFNRIHKMIRLVRQVEKIPVERPLVIVYDSIAVSPSEREFAETTLDLEEASKASIKEAGAGSDKPGERAKICSKELRKLPPILAENNVLVIFINQERQKIGVLFGDPNTTAGGGKALEYYTSMRARTNSFKTIKDELKNTIGVNISIKNTKNKVFRPFVELKDLRCFFDKGIDPFGGLLDVLLKAGRIKAVKAGAYQVQEPWAGGKEITFRSNKERNDVPYQALLECPTLVDASDKAGVDYYIQMFGSAIEAVQHDVASEEDVKEGET